MQNEYKYVRTVYALILYEMNYKIIIFLASQYFPA